MEFSSLREHFETWLNLGKGSIKKKKKRVEFSPLFGRAPPPLLHSKCGKTKKKFYGLKTVFRPFWAKKIFPFKMKKNLENFHEILSVSKHSHSEVGFILVISLGPEGVGSFADRKGFGGCWPPARGGVVVSAAHGGHQKPPCLAIIELGKADEVEQLPKWSRGLPHGSFPRNSLW